MNTPTRAEQQIQHQVTRVVIAQWGTLLLMVDGSGWQMGLLFVILLLMLLGEYRLLNELKELRQRR